VGPVSTCRREILRGWWRPMGLMVSFMIFTASVRNVLDTNTYFSQPNLFNLKPFVTINEGFHVLVAVIIFYK
jgi:hypothetical protein